MSHRETQQKGFAIKFCTKNFKIFCLIGFPGFFWHERFSKVSYRKMREIWHLKKILCKNVKKRYEKYDTFKNIKFFYLFIFYLYLFTYQLCPWQYLGNLTPQESNYTTTKKCQPKNGGPWGSYYWYELMGSFSSGVILRMM